MKNQVGALKFSILLNTLSFIIANDSSIRTNIRKQTHKEVAKKKNIYKKNSIWI